MPDDILDPPRTWADKTAYDAQAHRLRDLFRNNLNAHDDAAMGIKAVM
ncbi:hypothetical protein [Salinisphaera sp. Q1T1-3]|nr:hypothetical protein [Salinisphaera sp. Q1T1-3]